VQAQVERAGGDSRINAPSASQASKVVDASDDGLKGCDSTGTVQTSADARRLPATPVENAWNCATTHGGASRADGERPLKSALCRFELQDLSGNRRFIAPTTAYGLRGPRG